VDGEAVGACENGFLLLVGVTNEDDESDVTLLCDKIANLRIMEDENQNMNRSLADVNGGMLIISNFTLCADYRKGNRPDFFAAARPEQAIPLYEYFVDLVRRDGTPVATGEFGADMKIELCCDGPVTIVMESDKLKKKKESAQ
jgi:D-tyrosyl-tRNA(Tyr) deacylase